MDNSTVPDQGNQGSLTRSVAEDQYQQARLCLEQAQAERIVAVCRFLEAQAQWKSAASHDLCGDPCGDLGPAGGTDNPLDPLLQAETELYQAKSLYCAMLEQNQLVHWMLNQSRNAYQQAQAKLEQLAIDSLEGNENKVPPPIFVP